MDSSAGSLRQRMRRAARDWHLPFVVLLVAVAFVVMVFLIPYGSERVVIVGQFETAAGSGGVGYVPVWLPTNSAVSVHWIDQSGGIVQFLVLEPGSPVPTAVCEGLGTSGSCMFHSWSETYNFDAFNNVSENSQTMSFTATYPVVPNL